MVISSAGGTGGCDPSFQIFEKGVGICFEGFYKNIQEDLKTGMSTDHKRLISYFESNSQIREYCRKNQELTSSYNQILNEYASFLRIHSEFIKKFILANMFSPNEDDKDKKKAKGTGGTFITNMIERYKEVERQILI